MSTPQEIREFRTTDLSMAAYLRLRGLEVIRVEIVPGQKSKSQFVFDDTIDVAEHLAVEFTNSELQQYDSHVRALKKLIHR